MIRRRVRGLTLGGEDEEHERADGGDGEVAEDGGEVVDGADGDAADTQQGPPSVNLKAFAER